MRESEPHQLIWCLGMYASGSTWLFNAVREVASVLYPARRVTGRWAGGMKALKNLDDALNVVKTHELTPAAAKFMQARADVIFVSLRDPRDAVTSLKQHMGEDFAQALRRIETSARLAARHAGSARSRVFIYESGFTETASVFDDLAAALGGTLSEAQRRTLFNATRRGKIEEKISRLAELPTAWRNPANGDLLDRDTQWHRHHAGRSGETGRWRHALAPQEVVAIEHRLADFMRSFGYNRENRR
jgi:hypothetical protein